jgi:hypothetical protein
MTPTNGEHQMVIHNSAQQVGTHGFIHINSSHYRHALDLYEFRQQI